jgi:hypothetical protein
MSIKMKLSPNTPIQTNPVSGTVSIDWNLSDTFYTTISTNCSISFINPNLGKEIILSITNSSSNTINLTWPPGIIGAENSIPTGVTKTIKISYATSTGMGIYGTIIATTESSNILHPELLPKTFTSNGTFTIPSTVTTFYITCYPACGGGGGGGGTTYGVVGGGGGGGGYGANIIRQAVSTSPNTVYNIIIGQGGAGASGSTVSAGSGSSGGTTTITQGATIIMSAPGGTGGGGGAGGDYYYMNGGTPPGGYGGTIGGSSGGVGINTNASSGTRINGGAGGVNPLDSSIVGGRGGDTTISQSTGISGKAGSSGSNAKVIIEFS